MYVNNDFRTTREVRAGIFFAFLRHFGLFTTSATAKKLPARTHIPTLKLIDYWLIDSISTTCNFFVCQ
jgi:hypothetical protein